MWYDNKCGINSVDVVTGLCCHWSKCGVLALFQRQLIGLARDLRGVTFAFSTKISYMMLFDWMYPFNSLSCSCKICRWRVWFYKLDARKIKKFWLVTSQNHCFSKIPLMNEVIFVNTLWYIQGPYKSPPPPEPSNVLEFDCILQNPRLFLDSIWCSWIFWKLIFMCCCFWSCPNLMIRIMKHIGGTQFKL